MPRIRYFWEVGVLSAAGGNLRLSVLFAGLLHPECQSIAADLVSTCGMMIMTMRRDDGQTDRLWPRVQIR